MRKNKICFWILTVFLLAAVIFCVNYKPSETEISLPKEKKEIETVPESAAEKAEEVRTVSEPAEEKAEDNIVSEPSKEQTEEDKTVSESVNEKTETVEETKLSSVTPLLLVPAVSEGDSEESAAEDEALAPEAAVEESTEGLFCTLTVRCDDVFNNMDKLSESKKQIIPEDGIIFQKEKLVFSEGESVFDVLKRTMKERRIHMDFVMTPAYNSAYIKGIANLYEFDLGDTSGWIYTVNGESPMIGSSQYFVKNGDDIEFQYKCSFY